MIYLAGSCASDQRTMMVEIASLLKDAGYEVYCPFELKIPNAWDMSQEEWSQKVFEADIEALDQSDTLLMISPGRVGSAGTNWEQGYAYATGKKIYIIQYTDEPTSLMTYVGCDQFFNLSKSIGWTVSQLLTEMQERKEHSDRVYPKKKCKTVLT